jgi:hypothetical protein
MHSWLQSVCMGAFVSVTCVHEGSEILNGFEEL